MKIVMKKNKTLPLKQKKKEDEAENRSPRWWPTDVCHLMWLGGDNCRYQSRQYCSWCNLWNAHRSCRAHTRIRRSSPHKSTQVQPFSFTVWSEFSGFWEAYCTVRGFIHTVLRQELAARPAHVYCTGHSLGGALATIASLDLSLHSLPRINKYLKAQRLQRFVVVLRPFVNIIRLVKMAQNEEDEDSSIAGDHFRKLVHKVKLCLYDFGAPRVGNRHFAQQVNHWVPNSFRIGFCPLFLSSLLYSRWWRYCFGCAENWFQT